MKWHLILVLICDSLFTLVADHFYTNFLLCASSSVKYLFMSLEIPLGYSFFFLHIRKIYTEKVKDISKKEESS